MENESGNNSGNKQQSPQDDGVSDIKRRPVNQGGHEGMGGHGGQQSGGMGGMHGGDLHDIGSGQSGMTGRAGMGGNNNDHKQSGGAGNMQGGDDRLAEAGGHQAAEIQQSAQREGMGNHRHSSRGNEQAVDATDADDMGSRDSAAAERGPDEKTD